MSTPLAIITPDLGASIATFLKRHATDLLPGGTVVAGNRPGTQVPIDWSPNGPTVDLGMVGGKGTLGRVNRAIAPRLGLNLSIKGLRNFLRRHQVEVVMGQYLDYSVQWLSAAQDAGCRFFAHAHGHDVSGRLTDPVWRNAYLAYKQADGVITINECSRKALIELGIPEEKVFLVHYGVVVPAVAPDRLADSSNATIDCLAVGRMVPQKAPILLLDSFRRAAEKDGRLRLTYVGTGPLLPAVEQYVRAFQLQERVTLHRWKSNDEVRDLMKRAAIFLQHSATDPHTGDQEGLPLAILEAMAEALPVVSTFHAGIPEAVQHGSNGYLSQEGDTVEMSRNILKLAECPDTRKQMGCCGHGIAKARFTWQRERAQLLTILGITNTAA